VAGLALLCATALTMMASATPAVASLKAQARAATTVPRLDHVFLVMEENNGLQDIIGNPAAPNLNYLAKTFGLATDYYGASPDSSESNYVAILGGSSFNEVLSPRSIRSSST